MKLMRPWLMISQSVIESLQITWASRARANSCKTYIRFHQGLARMLESALNSGNRPVMSGLSPSSVLWPVESAGSGALRVLNL